MSSSYPQNLLDLAASRGYNNAAHCEAMGIRDAKAITLTHPFNWLKPSEVENALAPHKLPEITIEPRHKYRTAILKIADILYPGGDSDYDWHPDAFDRLSWISDELDNLNLRPRNYPQPTEGTN